MIDQYPERPPSVPQDQVILLPNNGWATVEDSKWILALKHPAIGVGPQTEIRESIYNLLISYSNFIRCEQRALQDAPTTKHDHHKYLQCLIFYDKTIPTAI